ncbi:MAG: transposase [Patescibacteria group bacterium]
MIDLRNQSLERSKIVDIHGWCLMKNHYHLLLSERVEGGLTLFIRKLNVGYANYFNEKYKRVGTLFQGRTKRIRITSDPHFLHILHYIHLNPLDFLGAAKEWRSGRVQNSKAARAQLERYRWSSYQDYSGKKNFPSILTMDFMRDALGNVKKKTLEYIDDINLAEIKPFLLE